MKEPVRSGRIEWPTIALITATYSAWFWLVLAGEGLPALIWIPAAGLLTTLYWSLVHEVVHGHPTSYPLVNRLSVALPLGWIYAYGRFRDTHLEHHATEELTDPFDDPESWYLPRSRWLAHSRLVKAVLRFNNTLFGRMLIGPCIAIARMVTEDGREILRGGKKGRQIAIDWFCHLIAVAILAAIVWRFSQVPLWWLAAAAYVGISILLIRTFIEHQACEHSGERTVIIEDSGPLAFIFLFNNLHVVHHTRPGLAWYRLPGFYRRHRAQFIRRNNGYVYPSYWQVFRRYFLTAKEPVPHPFAG